MSTIDQHQIIVGPFQCNCSILVCKKTKEAVIIDAGDDFDRIRQAVEKAGARVKYSLHTHAHLDHIGATEALKKELPETKILLHKDDEPLYKNLRMQGEMFGIEYNNPPPVDQFISHEEVLEFGDQKFEVIHTPGHSPGGVCLRFKENTLAPTPVVFTGDTLFQESIGRSDLWGADHQTLLRSIKQRLLKLDQDTRVCPGHGPNTSIAHEKRANPFL